jgi:hypothetical protein
VFIGLFGGLEDPEGAGLQSLDPIEEALSRSSPLGIGGKGYQLRYVTLRDMPTNSGLA